MLFWFMAKTAENSLTIYFQNPDLLSQAKRVAAHEDRSINRIIERALRNELAKPEYKKIIEQ